MLLSISSLPSRCKNRPKKTLVLKCDSCESVFERRFTLEESQAAHHFCARKCANLSQALGGSIDSKKKTVFLARYGVDNPMKDCNIRLETSRTCLDRYGSPFAISSQAVRDKIVQTNQERYGSNSHMGTTHFLELAKETWLKKYGEDNPMKSDVIKSKYDFDAVWKKAHETKKTRSSYKTSKKENLLRSRLETLFECVEYQVSVDHEGGTWLLDFKIGNVYVEYDGTYWHGLDRPLSVLIESKQPRDQAILRRYYGDRHQDEWFLKNGLRLIRIREGEERSLTDDELKSLLTSSEMNSGG